MKLPEIDEICHNLSCKGVNGWEFYKTQTTMLCNTIILRKAEVCPRKISHTFYKQSLFIFLQTVRPILIVSEHSPLMTKTYACMMHAIINVLPYEIVNVWKYELNPMLIQFACQIIVSQYLLNVRENRRHWQHWTHWAHTHYNLISSIQVWTQKYAVQKASVDVNISYY